MWDGFLVIQFGLYAVFPEIILLTHCSCVYIKCAATWRPNQKHDGRLSGTPFEIFPVKF